MVLAFFSFLLSLDDYVPLSHLKFVFLAVLGIKLEVARIKIGFEARLRPLGIATTITLANTRLAVIED